MIGSLRIRWSEHEAPKPYARPFGVSFVDADGHDRGSVALSGPDLLYLRQFQAAVLALSGELFDDSVLRDTVDPQRAWLDTLSTLLPALGDFRVLPRSSFDHAAGRVFRFGVHDGVERAVLDAPTLLEYQEFQAAVAHQSGRLARNLDVEDIADHNARQHVWAAVLRSVVERPTPDEAMTESWPWR